MIHSQIGLIAQAEWNRTFDLRLDMYLIQGAFVVMPDHVHAIIGIGRNPFNRNSHKMEFLANSAFDFNSISNGTDAMHGDAELIDRINAINEINAITHPIPDNSILPKIASNKFGPPLHNLGSIIRGYKSAVTMAARAINPNFAWQRGYHDRVIQSEIQLKRIHAYIENNVRRWKHIDG